MPLSHRFAIPRFSGFVITLYYTFTELFNYARLAGFAGLVLASTLSGGDKTGALVETMETVETVFYQMLALLRRTSFLTTIYGPYLSHHYTHVTNYNFSLAGLITVRPVK